MRGMFRRRAKKVPRLKLSYRSKYVVDMLDKVGGKCFPDIDWTDDEDMSAIVQSTTERMFSALIERTCSPVVKYKTHLEPLLGDEVFCHEFAAILVDFKKDLYDNLEGTKAQLVLMDSTYGEMDILSDDGDFLMMMTL